MGQIDLQRVWLKRRCRTKLQLGGEVDVVKVVEEQYQVLQGLLCLEEVCLGLEEVRGRCGELEGESKDSERRAACRQLREDAFHVRSQHKVASELQVIDSRAQFEVLADALESLLLGVAGDVDGEAAHERTKGWRVFQSRQGPTYQNCLDEPPVPVGFDALPVVKGFAGERKERPVDQTETRHRPLCGIEVSSFVHDNISEFSDDETDDFGREVRDWAGGRREHEARCRQGTESGGGEEGGRGGPFE